MDRQIIYFRSCSIQATIGILDHALLTVQNPLEYEIMPPLLPEERIYELIITEIVSEALESKLPKEVLK